MAKKSPQFVKKFTLTERAKVNKFGWAHILAQGLYNLGAIDKTTLKKFHKKVVQPTLICG